MLSEFTVASPNRPTAHKQRDVARQKLEAFYEAAGEGRDEAKIEKLGQELGATLKKYEAKAVSK